jgi:hypothetical protein
MSAANYSITFGYGATDGYYYGPNGIVGKYHRGNDRPCPTGTSIVIGEWTIGLTGATGLASGPHLHTQACSAGSNYSDDFNPSPYEFKYGTVIKAGWHNQFGNHIVIRTGNVDLTYAHLSKINVSVGQVLSAPQGSNINMFANDQEVKEAYLMLRGNEGTPGERAGWIGQSKQRFFQLAKAEADSFRQQLADVRQALVNEQAKPAKEIVKEVEKIVEKPIEVIVEVPAQVDEKAVVTNWFKKIWESLFQKKG